MKSQNTSQKTLVKNGKGKSTSYFWWMNDGLFVVVKYNYVVGSYRCW